MTKEHFISSLLSPLFKLPVFRKGFKDNEETGKENEITKMVDFLSDELGRGTKYLQKNSKDYKNKIITSLAFVEEAIKADNSLFRHFGYDQNNTFKAPRQDKILKMIPVVIEFLVENKKMIIQLLDNVSELSFKRN